MPIQSSPLLGYNNNVRHRGRVFHIQTEDSGVKYGHIMTHLFTDGGRILKSVKTSYAEYIGSERMPEIVREMMKQQHKAMYIALRDGKFDAITEGTTNSLSPVGSASPSVAKGAVSLVASKAPPLPGSAEGRLAPPHASTPSAASASALASREAEELTLDVEVLERAASTAEGQTEGASPSELPPPPANLLREKRAAAVGLKPPVPAQAGRKPSAAVAKAAVNERRYAPTRPASIFGQARPQQGKSIFGEDLMSDKSLDEVILSYLADDLETEKK